VVLGKAPENLPKKLPANPPVPPQERVPGKILEKAPKIVPQEKIVPQGKKLEKTQANALLCVPERQSPLGGVVSGAGVSEVS
jgi:hypothetical protein